MTRTEALRRLEGTWTFELHAGRVDVRELSLVRALEDERVESAAARPARSSPASASPAWG